MHRHRDAHHSWLYIICWGQGTLLKQKGHFSPPVSYTAKYVCHVCTLDITLQFNSEQVFPTCIRLVVDVSGSMYRFNGYDGRLDRSVEAVLMVMEACQKLQNYKVSMQLYTDLRNTPTYLNNSWDYVIILSTAYHHMSLLSLQYSVWWENTKPINCMPFWMHKYNMHLYSWSA